MTALTPRMALPNRPVARRYGAPAIEVAKVLYASGHEPNGVVLGTLRLISERNPHLSFADFISGCGLSRLMEEAASAERGTRMNAPGPVPTVCVDPLAAFERQCAYWAGRYAVGRVPLQRVADLLEAMAPLDMPADDAQRIIADAITTATVPTDDDDYAELTGSFARLCVEADAKYRSSPDAEQHQQRRERLAKILASPGFAIAVSQPDHVAESTAEAAEYLIREADPARLTAFISGRSAGQRAAIFRETERRKAARERAKKQKQRKGAA